MKVKVKWDLTTDDREEPYSLEEAGVKEIVDVPDNIDEEEVTDWLSDTYGWLHYGWVEIDE